MQVDDQGAGAYAEIFNSSAESIIVANHQGVIIMANPQSERLFGYAEGGLINKPIEALIPKELRGGHVKHRAKYQQELAPRQMGTGRDLVGLRNDGVQFPIEVSLNPAKIQGQQVVIAFVIDITERKKIEMALESSEKQLVQYAAELERRVNDRTKELATTVQQLEDSNQRLENEINDRKKAEQEARKSLERQKELNELKSRFVSMASHEFRTPLSTILSSTALLAKYDGAGNEDKKRKHIDRIKSNVYDLTGILNDFLSLDKLEQGRIENHAQLLDLIPFIDELIEELSQLTKKDQSIVFENGMSTYQYNIDPQILKHILSNLVSNAVKYSDVGDQITVALTHSNGGITLSVEDQGVGIPLEDQKHLFERFFRAHNVTHIQGTGLGLNLVKKYLDLIGGTIEYQSAESKGSIFKISLPKNTSDEENSID